MVTLSSPDFLEPLLAALQDLERWMRGSGTPYVVIGGVAASLLGRPRLTQDVDVTVSVDPTDWQRLLNFGAEHGFNARRSNVLEFAKQNRVLLLRHGPSGINLDMALGALPFEEQAIRRARLTVVGDLTIPLPTPEDLVIMKAVAHRPRDADDIEAVLDLHPNLDRRRILRWVRDFANVLETPEILTDLQVALRRHPRRH